MMLNGILCNSPRILKPSNQVIGPPILIKSGSAIGTEQRRSHRANTSAGRPHLSLSTIHRRRTKNLRVIRTIAVTYLSIYYRHTTEISCGEPDSAIAVENGIVSQAA